MSKKLSNKIVGIDLGTTNSCVSIIQGNEIKVILNKEGKNTTPSVVFFNEKGEKLAVGQAAKGQAIIKPEQVVFETKRLIGRKFESPEVQEFLKISPFQIVPAKNSDVRIKVGGKEYSPEQISAFVLEKMKETAEDYLGETIKKAVITVPAYFDDAQRQATKDAGEIAGLEVVRIINEPTAAALAYGIDKKKQLRTIAVFDLGGGTFDISIIEINEGVFEVKATNGDTFLGGANFDQKIIDWLIKEFENEQGINLGRDKLALQRLKEAAENAKHELSFLESEDSNKAIVDISIPFISADASGPKHLSKKLSRRKLEEITADLLEKLIPPCKNCLKDAGVTKVDEVILVGGMTRMPSVREKVKAIFGKEPNKSVSPDEAVAMGAAVQGGVLTGDTKDILLLDVTPLSLGIEVQGARGEGGINDIIIPRNTTIPTDKKKIYSTAEDNQPSVHIRVLQGERTRALDNKVLGTFELSGIEPAPRGIPQIEVTFDIDANGIVKVSAKDKKTNKEANITITDSSGLSREEVERMVREAEEKRVEDEEVKNNIETLSRAQVYCDTFEKQIEDLRGRNNFQEDDSQFQEFKKLYDDLKETTRAAEEAEKERKKEKCLELKKQIDKIEELMKLANELETKFPKKEESKQPDEDILDVKPEKNNDDEK